MNSRVLFTISLTWLLTAKGLAQISPPGLDDTNAAFWGAMAVSQNLTDKWNLTLYAGANSQSNPDNFNMLLKPAIYVLNGEAQYKFNHLFAVSFCASARIQHRYEKIAPYEPA